MRAAARRRPRLLQARASARSPPAIRLPVGALRNASSTGSSASPTSLPSSARMKLPSLSVMANDGPIGSAPCIEAASIATPSSASPTAPPSCCTPFTKRRSSPAVNPPTFFAHGSDLSRRPSQRSSSKAPVRGGDASSIRCGDASGVAAAYAAHDSAGRSGRPSGGEWKAVAPLPSDAESASATTRDDDSDELPCSPPPPRRPCIERRPRRRHRCRRERSQPPRASRCR